jgi:hypothetical protein
MRITPRLHPVAHRDVAIEREELMVASGGLIAMLSSSFGLLVFQTRQGQPFQNVRTRRPPTPPISTWSSSGRPCGPAARTNSSKSAVDRRRNRSVSMGADVEASINASRRSGSSDDLHVDLHHDVLGSFGKATTAVRGKSATGYPLSPPRPLGRRAKPQSHTRAEP